MTQDTVINLATQSMTVAMRVSLPILMVGLVIGLVVSVIQAVTQIQEQSLAFIPKILAMAIVMVVGGPWMLGQLLAFTSELWISIPNLVG